MPPRYKNDLFERAARGERTERTPVWLMRQAGRTDPEYLKLRESVGLPLEALFRHPELATRISLLPQRLGVDAIIFYQDILTPLSPMGGHFVFAPGPVLENPIERVEDLDRFEPYDIAAQLPFVRETLLSIRGELDDSLPVLGFAGAPLTLAVFLIEGGSFSHSAPKSLHWLHENPAAVHRLLERLTAMTIAYLQYQAECGVAAVQLFESAAFLLDDPLYEQFALPYQQAIFAALKPYVKSIVFARDWNRLDHLAAAGADIISLPASISITEARSQLGASQVLQGNLDNKMLVKGAPAGIAAAAEACVREGGHQGHIFNLSHGLLKETPFENVQCVVDTVRNCRVT
ncbi:MAG: uroporphyrinogen decarboxylase [Candidatus Hydrogenedens sp.]|nr:uroporphyrinogen decarboxylase [Candidatus Hydrogenedens sp.]